MKSRGKPVECDPTRGIISIIPNIKEFINTQKVFNATMEEKLNKIDDLFRSVDRISHDAENLKIKNFVRRVEESIKALYFLWMKVRKEPLCLELEENF